MTRANIMRLAALAAVSAMIPGVSGAQRLTGPNPTGAVPAPVSLETRGLFQEKFASVGSDVFISGQPTERALRDLRAQGVVTVVNLRTPEFPYSPTAVKSFAAAMTGAKGKVLLHCTIAWRASHLWAAYLIQYRDVPVATALQQARMINLMDDMRMDGDKQPVESFLGRTLPEVGHPKQ